MMTANMTSVSMVSSFRSNHNSNVCACRRPVLPRLPQFSLLALNDTLTGGLPSPKMPPAYGA